MKSGDEETTVSRVARSYTAFAFDHENFTSANLRSDTSATYPSQHNTVPSSEATG